MTAVKFVKGSRFVVEGLAIPYGGPFKGKDLDGEDFGPDTDLALDWFPDEGRPGLYHHALDADVKLTRVGQQIKREERPEGQWAQMQIDKNNKYLAEIQHLVDEGALSFSSGAMAHLVQTRKDGHIERWPWVELSLTPTPANPDALVYAVKATDLIEHLAASEVPIPSELVASALKALDESHGDSLPDGLSYADEGDRLLVAVKAFVGRSQDLVSMRAKAGRLLSETHRQRLVALDGQLDVMHADIKGLLAGPEAEAAAVAALEAEWDFITTGLPEVVPV